MGKDYQTYYQSNWGAQEDAKDYIFQQFLSGMDYADQGLYDIAIRRLKRCWDGIKPMYMYVQGKSDNKGIIDTMDELFNKASEKLYMPPVRNERIKQKLMYKRNKEILKYIDEIHEKIPLLLKQADLWINLSVRRYIPPEEAIKKMFEFPGAEK